MHQEMYDILLVDDRPENLLALEAVLSSPAYNLISLHSGEQALKYILQNDLDRLALILLDVQMPGMDGYETAKLIKERRELRHVPILFITAIYKSKEHVQKGYAAGSSDYIFKPFDPKVLRAKVDSFIEMYRFQRGVQKKNAILQSRYSELEALNAELWETRASLIEHQQILEELVNVRTEQLREANREILNSQRLFQTIFYSNPSLLAIRRLRDGRFLEVNRMWLQTTGFSLETLNSEGGDLLQLRSEEAGVDVVGAATLVEQAGFSNVKVSFRTRSGESRYGLLSIENLEINQEACRLFVINDITEKEMWQMQLDRLERLNLIGEMAAGIAHEIRNPMTTIRGFLQLCKNNGGVLPDEHIDMVLEELQRANGIITEFLTLAKNKTSHFEFLSLNGIIESLLPLIQAEAALTHKEIRTECREIPDLLLDEKEIRQVLLNLCMNGLEAMEGGGTLTVRTYRSGGYVVLEVEDTGMGIPEEVMSKLGTPFFTTKEKGTGLGLALCYSIAARHRASISVKGSAPGTTFSVRFPVHSLP
jgi:two-component system, sporulation sensor kinase E